MRSTSKIPPKLSKTVSKVVAQIVDLIDAFGFHFEVCVVRAHRARGRKPCGRHPVVGRRLREI